VRFERFVKFERFMGLGRFKRFKRFNAFKRLGFRSADVGVFTNHQSRYKGLIRFSGLRFNGLTW